MASSLNGAIQIFVFNFPANSLLFNNGDYFTFTVPKDVTCFVCDSRKDSFCADPFNSTEISLSHTRPCEGECLKWEREVDPGNRE